MMKYLAFIFIFASVCFSKCVLVQDSSFDILSIEANDKFIAYNDKNFLYIKDLETAETIYKIELGGGIY